MEGMRTALLALALCLLPGLASADGTLGGQGGQSIPGAVTPAAGLEYPITTARRRPRCRRVCNYVTNKCRNLHRCRTTCSYYETVPADCVP